MTRPARLPRTTQSDHERYLECVQCHATILVGGWVKDIDPATFRGVSCGCRRPKTDAQLRADKQVRHAQKTHDPIPF